MKELKIQMLRAGITQADVARRFNVSRQYVNQILKGQSKSKLAKEIREYVNQAVSS